LFEETPPIEGVGQDEYFIPLMTEGKRTDPERMFPPYNASLPSGKDAVVIDESFTKAEEIVRRSHDYPSEDPMIKVLKIESEQAIKPVRDIYNREMRRKFYKVTNPEPTDN
jgi:hypothetical protein